MNPAAFDDLVRLCVQLDKLRHGTPGREPATAPDELRAPRTAGRQQPDVPAAFGGARSREALEQAIIGKAVELLSGPGGLAQFLRRKLLGARLGGPSLPLDIGYSNTVPAAHPQRGPAPRPALRMGRPVHQPASACQVHHTKHKANGGKTSLTGLRPALPLPPPDHDPPARLDPGSEPGRHHHRLEQGQDQSPPQPRATRPRRVTARPQTTPRRQHRMTPARET